jgi:hypothetical protein
VENIDHKTWHFLKLLAIVDLFLIKANTLFNVPQKTCLITC